MTGDDPRIKAAFLEFDGAMRKCQTWRHAVRAALVAADNPITEAANERIAALEAALRQVEAWSIDTATDLTPAGYESWSELLHGPRKRWTREQAIEAIEAIERRGVPQ